MSRTDHRSTERALRVALDAWQNGDRSFRKISGTQLRHAWPKEKLRERRRARRTYRVTEETWMQN